MKKDILLVLSTILLSSCSVQIEDSQKISEEKSIISENKSDEVISSEVVSSEEIVDLDLLDKWPETDCYAFSYKKLGKDVMPIGAWCAPIGEYITDEQYGYIKEAGLNSIYGLYETVDVNLTLVKKSLQCAANNGLIYLVRDNSLYAKSDDIDEFCNHMEQFVAYDSYGGTLIVDEPSAKSFANLGVTMKLFRQYYTSYAHYVNLFPNYARAAQLEGMGDDSTMDYETYVKNYLDIVKPQFLSYDYYPVSGDENTLSSTYFDQIYFISNIANQYKIPFWTFIQTCNFGGRSRVPKESEIYWQVNTSLAYGAKGIQYFCYFMPTEFSNEGFEGCLIDKDGKKTHLYPYVSAINNQIANMDEVLMHSTLVGQMANGQSPAAPINQDDLVDSIREIKKVTTDDNVIISCFDYNGKSVYYIVNNSIIENATLQIDFTSLVKANVVNIEGKSNFEGKSTIINLSPGQGVMYELTNYK